MHADAVRRAVESMESSFLSQIPGYAFVKGIVGGLSGSEDDRKMTPVLASFDDARQIAKVPKRLNQCVCALFSAEAADPTEMESPVGYAQLSPRDFPIEVIYTSGPRVGNQV